MQAFQKGTSSLTPLLNSSQGTQISREQLQRALDANKKVQQILSQRAEALETELREADQLLSTSSNEDGMDDPESEVSVPGAKKAIGLFPPSEFLNPVSPFYEDAAKRSAYMANTSPHPMKAKDLEVLADAVRREKGRLQAYQQRSEAALEFFLTKTLIPVARKVSENATAGQCQARWYKSLDPGLQRGSWTEEEDNRLRKAVAGFGTSWVQVAAAIPGRTNDQCRERWVEQLNPSASKLVWTEEEDKVLIESVKQLGHQWKAVCLKCRMRYDKLQRSPEKLANPGPSASPLSFQTVIPVFPQLRAEAPLTRHAEGPFRHYSPSTAPISTPRPQPRPVGKGKHKETTIEAFTMTIPYDSAKDAEGTSQTSAPKRSKKMTTLQTPGNLDGSDSAAAATTKPRPKPRPGPRVKDSVPGQAVVEVPPDLTRGNAEPPACAPDDNSMSAPQMGDKDGERTLPQKRGRERKETSDMAQSAPSVPIRASKRLRATRASKSFLEATDSDDAEDLAAPGPSTIGNSELEAGAQAGGTVQQLKRGRKRRLDADAPISFVDEPGAKGHNKEQAGSGQLVPPPTLATAEEAPGPDANDVTPVKRKRGRPRKVPAPLSMTPAVAYSPAPATSVPDPLATTGEAVKRGRGRPRKTQQASDNA
ncbi:hypothetical protein NLJ89_g5311 [Agrocybe chaxingu]|uniref:Uncharacterized protein n=1 Tax=Agrocybe chaxingu TaxID=84603 RepID=A0A9W8K1H1_9AGAR|nr:hypothetical protein NLJ89_g5311 [Agrocybe chaxingu]